MIYQFPCFSWDLSAYDVHANQGYKRRLPEQIFMSQIYLMEKIEQQIFASSLKCSAPVMTLDSSDTQKHSEAVVRSRLQKYGANEYEESKSTAVDILRLNP